jgi:hypothetical protein
MIEQFDGILGQIV